MYASARIGLVVPEYVPIHTIEELGAHTRRFSGEIVGIDAGTGIMKCTEKAIPEYGLDYRLMISSGPAMTALLKKAIDKKEWIVVTGWTPHWMFDRFRLRVLEDSRNVYGGGRANPFHCKGGGWRGGPRSPPPFWETSTYLIPRSTL